MSTESEPSVTLPPDGEQNIGHALQNCNSADVIFHHMPDCDTVIGLPRYVPEVYFGGRWRQLYLYQGHAFVVGDADVWTFSPHDVGALRENGLLQYRRRADATLLGHATERGSDRPIWLARSKTAFWALCVSVTDGPIHVTAEAHDADLTAAVRSARDTLTRIARYHDKYQQGGSTSDTSNNDRSGDPDPFRS